MDVNTSTFSSWTLPTTMEIMSSTFSLLENSSLHYENNTGVVYCNLNETEHTTANTTQPPFYLTTVSYETSTIFENSSLLNNSSFPQNFTINGTDCVMLPEEKTSGGWHISCLRMFKFQFIVFGWLMGIMEVLGFIFNWLSFIVIWPDR